MRRSEQDENKKLVPLKRIARASSYGLGYLSILVQRKKLKAKKIGNKYFTTKEWFDEYLELHARDAKRSPAIVFSSAENLPVEDSKTETKKVSNQKTTDVDFSVKKVSSEAESDLENRIDSLVERLVNKKMAGLIPAEGTPAVKEEMASIVETGITPPSAAPEIKLDEILNKKIKRPPARLVAGLHEPAKKLESEWKVILTREEKEIKAAVRFAAKEAKAGVAETAAKEEVIGKPAVNFKNFFNSPRWTQTFKPLAKATVAAGVIILVLVFSANIVPYAAERVEALTRGALSSDFIKQTSESLKKIARLPSFNLPAVPGADVVANLKSSLSRGWFDFTDRAGSVNSELGKNIDHRNEILARRLGFLKGQAFFVGSFWRDRFNASLGTDFASLIPESLKRTSENSLAMLKGFIGFQGKSIADIVELAKNQTAVTEREEKINKGNVAGASESAVNPPVPSVAEAAQFSKFLALANTTSRRGREVIDQVKYDAANALANSAESQRELSLTLGRQLELLIRSGAQAVGKLSQAGSDQLLRLQNSINPGWYQYLIKKL